jgi:hypothetical protein
MILFHHQAAYLNVRLHLDEMAEIAMDPAKYSATGRFRHEQSVLLLSNYARDTSLDLFR